MKLKEITVSLDMYGCPNRCRHCWLGVTPNGNSRIAYNGGGTGFSLPEQRQVSLCIDC